MAGEWDVRCFFGFTVSVLGFGVLGVGLGVDEEAASEERWGLGFGFKGFRCTVCDCKLLRNITSHAMLITPQITLS